MTAESNTYSSNKEDFEYESLKDYKDLALKHEEFTFHPKAAFSKDHMRLEGPENDHRLPYKRDVDRIVHSKAYSRYMDKTQVVYLVDNDHITHRGLHVQLVSNFARGIAEILRLNLDLVEAISLGHDVGHPPFGHEGEGYLSELSEEYGEGFFAHPWQSCRLLSQIEPLNLGLAVYDGFLCHDGGMSTRIFRPQFEKNEQDHKKELAMKLAGSEKNIMPCSLEGCLVKICDTMSYIGRDIEDAINIGIIQRSQIPETFLGNTNRQILSTLSCDIIKNSYDKDYIAISEGASDALKTLRAFNFENIYIHPKLKVESQKIKRSYRILFEILLEDYTRTKDSSHLWTRFLSNKNERYLSETSPARSVIDYIAGMTDSFFVKTLEKLVVPKQIELF